VAYALGWVVGVSEGQCYGTELGLEVAWGGVSIDQAVENVMATLRGQGLSGKQLAAAKAILELDAATLRIGGDPGGVIEECETELREIGWQG
jgi:hypothetical protein